MGFVAKWANKNIIISCWIYNRLICPIYCDQREHLYWIAKMPFPFDAAPNLITQINIICVMCFILIVFQLRIMVIQGNHIFISISFLETTFAWDGIQSKLKYKIRLTFINQLLGLCWLTLATWLSTFISNYCSCKFCKYTSTEQQILEP